MCPSLGQSGRNALSGGGRLHLSFSRTTTHEGGSAPTRRGSSFRLSLRSRTYWQGLTALVQVSAALQPIEPSQPGGVAALFCSHLGAVLSCFRWGRTCVSGALSQPSSSRRMATTLSAISVSSQSPRTLQKSSPSQENAPLVSKFPALPVNGIGAN